jgi:hypothetical protein
MNRLNVVKLLKISLKSKQWIKIKKKLVIKLFISKNFFFLFLKILPILVLCNEVVSDERRSNFSQTDGEQWTAKDKCFGKLTKKNSFEFYFS